MIDLSLTKEQLQLILDCMHCNELCDDLEDVAALISYLILEAAEQGVDIK